MKKLEWSLKSVLKNVRETDFTYVDAKQEFRDGHRGEVIKGHGKRNTI